MSSMPAEMRTRPSVMPRAARRSAGTEACVIVAGCEMSVSTPPRLSASATAARELSSRRRPRAIRGRTRSSRRSRASAASPARAADATAAPGSSTCLHLRVRLEKLAPARDRSRCAAPSGAAASSCRAAPATNRTGRGSRPRRSARTSATRCRRPASRRRRRRRCRCGRSGISSCCASPGRRRTRSAAGCTGSRTCCRRRAAASCGGRASAAAARSVRRMTGLVGVSTNSMRVAGVIARSTSSRFDVSTYENERPIARQHLVEQPERAAVRVVGDDDVVAGLEHRARSRRSPPCPTRTRTPALPPSIAAMLPFEREARRILRARVLVALVLAELVLHVGRRLVDRRDDGAGRGIGFLAGVQADGAEARVRV